LHDVHRGTIGVDTGKNGLLVLQVRATTSGVLNEVAQVRTPRAVDETPIDGNTEESKDSTSLLLVRRATHGLDAGLNDLQVPRVSANAIVVGEAAQVRSRCTCDETARDGLGINRAKEKGGESDTLDQHHRGGEG